MYNLDAEVMAKIEDLSKYQQICNLLVEKLDEHVKLSPPELLHGLYKLDNIRLVIL